jgi:hypothetical protein
VRDASFFKAKPCFNHCAERGADLDDSAWSVDIAPDNSDDEVVSKRVGTAAPPPALDYGIPDDGQVRLALCA